MKKNGVSMSVKVASGLIILLLAVVIGSAIFSKLNALSSLTNPDIQICLQSAITTGTISMAQDNVGKVVPLNGLVVVPFNCPVTVKKISIPNINSANSGDQTRMKEFGYSDSAVAQFKTDVTMWNEIAECYQKVNYGRNNLFDRSLISIDNPKYCVVCSVVTFDDNVQKEIAGAVQIDNLVYKKIVSGSGKTLPQLTTGRSKVIGSLESTYSTIGKQAVIYYRAPASRYQTWYGSRPVSAYFRLLAQPFEYSDLPENQRPTNVGESVILALAEADNDSWDIDGVVIVPYESKDSLSQYCDIRGNEKYIP